MLMRWKWFLTSFICKTSHLAFHVRSTCESPRSVGIQDCEKSHFLNASLTLKLFGLKNIRSIIKPWQHFNLILVVTNFGRLLESMFSASKLIFCYCSLTYRSENVGGVFYEYVQWRKHKYAHVWGLDSILSQVLSYFLATNSEHC